MKFATPVFTKSGFLSLCGLARLLFWPVVADYIRFLCEILFSLESEKSRLFGAISRELTYEVSKGSL